MNTKKMYVISRVDPGWKIFLSRDDDLIPIDENTYPISEKSTLIAVNQRDMKIIKSMVKDIQGDLWVAKSKEFEFDSY